MALNTSDKSIIPELIIILVISAGDRQMSNKNFSANHSLEAILDNQASDSFPPWDSIILV